MLFNKLRKVMKKILINCEILLLIYVTHIQKNSSYSNKYFPKNIYNKTLLNRNYNDFWNLKNIKKVNTLFLRDKIRTGNFLISVNNALIFCEFVGCKKLIIEYNKNIFINHPIITQNYCISIEPNRTLSMYQ